MSEQERGAGYEHYHEFLNAGDVFERTDDPNKYPIGLGHFPYAGDMYHTDRKRLSSSVCKMIVNDPAKFPAWKVGGSISKDYYDFGHVVGDLINLADGDRPSEKFFYADCDKPDGRTKVGQATKAFAESHAGGKPVIWLDVFHQAKLAAERLKAHGEVQLFHGGAHVLTEFAIQAPIPLVDGTACPAKCMFDWVKFVGPREIEVIDVKTSSYPSPRSFRRQVHDFGYHVQEYFYRTVAAACGLKVTRFRFAVVGSDDGAYPAVYELDAGLVFLKGCEIVGNGLTKWLAEQKGEFDYLPDWSRGTQEIHGYRGD